MIRARLLACLLISAVFAACEDTAAPLDLSGSPAVLTIVEGDNQTGPGGSPLGTPLSIYLADGAGRPVPARQVVWTTDGGLLSATIDSTDDAGSATVVWTLGTTPGPQEAQATVAGVGTVTFSATATPQSGELSFRFIDAGSYHTCGITTTEELYCWGYNGDGQHGVAPSEPIHLPTLVPDAERFRMVTGGRYHSCGITLSGEVACWGEDKDGRLGERTFPTTYQSAQAGYVHSCAISLARKLFCWGYNLEGQLGVGLPQEHFIPVDTLVGDGYRAVAVGGLHTCATRETGLAQCWGFGAEGQLGNGGAATMFLPTAVSGGTIFRTDPSIAPPAPDPAAQLPPGPFIAAGFAHTCAIRQSDSQVLCWGLGQSGQLGTGGTAGSPTPVVTSGGQTFLRVTAGHRHSCALTVGGQAYCWGDNTFGQLGDGTSIQRQVPTLVSGGHAWIYLKAGELHTCGVTNTLTGYCWGNNEYGQLGDGTTSPSTTPRKIAFQP